MVAFTSLFVAAAAVTGAFAMPTSEQASNSTLLARSGTGNSQGTNNGFYYQFWSNGGGNVVYTNGAAGKYTVNWSNVGDFTGGKGWNPGSARTIKFNAQYNPGSSGGSLAVYGWTTSPLVEYYIMEDYTGSGPGGTFVGTVNSDGANYNIYKHQQVNQPSISGTQTFWQYISVRQGKRTSGSVTTGNHFNAWKSHGLNLGKFNYQILSTESYGGGSGSSTVTVS